MGYNNMSSKVFVGGLDERTQKEDIEDLFRNAGPLLSVWVARSPPGFAFVEFEDHRDAEDAVHDLDGSTILGRRVRIEIAHGGDRRGGRRAGYDRRYDRGYDRD